MANLILPSRGLDRDLTYPEVEHFLRSRWGSRGGMDNRRGFVPALRRLLYTTFIYIKRESDPVIIDHPLRDDVNQKAELEWWQQDHKLAGFGWAFTKGEAVDQALACARRGNLEAAGITAWLNRSTRQLEIYERSPREQPRGEDGLDNISTWYRPTGRQLTREQLAGLAGINPAH
jgi:hypothetical protein